MKKLEFKVRRIHLNEEARRYIRQVNETKFHPGALQVSLVSIHVLFDYFREFIYDQWEPQADWIRFDREHLVVEGKGSPQEFRIEALQNLRFEFNSPKYDLAQKPNAYSLSNVSFDYEGSNYKFYFKSLKSRALKLFKFLLDAGVKFKEYNDNRRVHFGRKPAYKQVFKLNHIIT